jgi:hypothetical protein
MPDQKQDEVLGMPPLKMVLLESPDKKEIPERRFFRELERKLATENALRKLILHIRKNQKQE